MRARRRLLPLPVLVLLLASPLAAAERPTGNGDPIGIATSDRAGRLTLQLRSVECDGTIVEGLHHSAPGDADHAATLNWLGGIAPGETKPIRARGLAPCPKRPRRR